MSCSQNVIGFGDGVGKGGRDRGGGVVGVVLGDNGAQQSVSLPAVCGDVVMVITEHLVDFLIIFYPSSSLWGVC